MSNRLDGMSMNIEQTEMEKLKAVFPQCFAEGKLDIDKLLSLCGEYIDNDFEKYKFEWKGAYGNDVIADKIGISLERVRELRAAQLLC